MNLPPYTLSDEPPSPILNVTLNNNSNHFATSTTEGWVVYSTSPLAVISRRGNCVLIAISERQS